MREPRSDDDADRPGPWWTADAADFAGAEPPLEGLEPLGDSDTGGTVDGGDTTHRGDTGGTGESRDSGEAPVPSGRSQSEAEPSGGSSDADQDATVGTAAVEFARLLGALGDWASANGVTDNLRRIGDEAAAAVSQAWAEQQARGTAEKDDAAHRDQSGAFVPCEVCPLCQGMVLAREVAPPLMQAAAKALAVIDDALRNASDD